MWDVAAPVINAAVRKESEDRTRKSSNPLILVGLMTPDGTLIEANSPAIGAAGLGLADVLGKKVWDTYWWSNSGDMQHQLGEACGRAFNGEVVRFDVAMRTAKDARKWVNFQICPVQDEKGRVTHLITSVFDISQRKKEEEGLRQSRNDFDRAQSVGQIGSWRFNIRGNTMECSDEALRIFGISSKGTLSYVDVLQCVHQEDRGWVEERWQSALLGDGGDIEHRIVAGGEVKWVREDVFPEYSVGRRLLGSFGVVRDITEEKIAEMRHAMSLQELHQAQAELAKNERFAALGRLAGSVAHEMRNPLGIVGNTAFFLRQTLAPYDETVGEALAELERAVTNSNHIINEMLDYVRDPIPRAADFLIGDAISSAIRSVSIPEGIRLTVQEDTKFEVFANEGQITRILINLIQNGIQAMPNGGNLEIGVISKQPEKVSIFVRDFGCGISEENLEKIFEPLFTTKARGIGLGLAIAKRYAQLNGGNVSVESQTGRGATFWLRLNLSSSVSPVFKTDNQMIGGTA